jgi:hypothetical protein
MLGVKKVSNINKQNQNNHETLKTHIRTMNWQDYCF